MAGTVLLAVLSAAALLTAAHGAQLSLSKQVRRYPTCTGPSSPFPNPADCSTYYQCTSVGHIALLSCPPGLQFSAQTGLCDYPQNAKCEVSSPPNGADTSANNEKPSGNGGSSSASSSLPECPYPADPYDVVHFPNPDDCSSFYKCGLDGNPVLIPCPQGLEWNAATEYCDYPESAGCTVSPGNSGSSSASKPTGSSNTSPPECPYPADPANVVQYPNPDNCSTFYKCGLDGEPVLIACPEGLEYNADAQVCDFPASAGCSVPSGHSASSRKPTGTLNTPPECPYPADPNVVVHFPNPDDCSSFYKCGLDGKPVLIPCPDGLEWNAATEACDYPESAGCTVSSGSGDSASASRPSGNSNTPPPKCPYPADPYDVVHFPNPDDCSSFYKCGLDGNPVLIPCPQGLEWNAATEYCDYPESAGCTVSPGNSGSSSASKPTGSSNTSPPECPYPADPANVVQYPNPDNCSTFYKCGLDGKPVLIACPEGLEYNAEAQVCDFPASAGCSVPSGHSASSRKPTGTLNTPPECPYPADPNVVVHFPNPDDCSSFYKCGLDGKPVLIPCPDGLQWNAATEACDYPEVAGCSVSSGGSDSASAGKPSGNSDTPPPKCPYPADPYVVVHFPNPDDCSSFYKCGLDGNPVLIPCPQGLEWNAATEYCDYPESAGCTVSPGNSGSSSASKPTGSSNTSPPECPYPADPVNVVQYPNPDNCSTFYKCGLDGEPVLIACPEGLEYNAEAKVCDFPASAGCSIAGK